MEHLLRQVHEGQAATEDQRTVLKSLRISDQRRTQEIDTQMKKLHKMQVS